MATAPKAVPKAVPKADAAEVPPPAKKSKKKLFIIIGAVVLLAGGGAAAFFMKGSDAPPGEAKAVKQKVEAPVFVVLDPFTLNLQPETGEQFLQVSITLQVADLKEVDNFKVYMPLVRSRLLLLLSGKKASEISSVAGKKKLAEEILASLKVPFAGGGEAPKVTDVLLTQFVIQ